MLYLEFVEENTNNASFCSQPDDGVPVASMAGSMGLGGVAGLDRVEDDNLAGRDVIGAAYQYQYYSASGDVKPGKVLHERLFIEGIHKTPDHVVRWVAFYRKRGKRPDLVGAKLEGLNLEQADLSGVDLRDANLMDTNLSGADLRGAGLRGADLSGADLRGTDLSGANLHEAKLHGAKLQGANLHGANLREANLCGADLRDANLREADLGSAKLRWAILLGANLHGANLREANLREANLLGVKCDGHTWLPDGSNWMQGADLACFTR